jgi:hypothetical protein
MKIPQQNRHDWLGRLAFPLIVFAASRSLLFAFATFAPRFGARMGGDPALSPIFVSKHPAWAALGHGELSGIARVARLGWTGATDAGVFPLVPLLGRWLGVAVDSPEVALVLLSLLACAVGFCGVYALGEHLRGRDAARFAVAILAAFPFSYHLSDGGALGCGLALSVWGTWFGLRGAYGRAAILLSLGVLAHPAVLGAAAVVALAETASVAKPWVKVAAASVPVLVVVDWVAYLRQHLHLDTAALWAALWPKAALATPAWTALLAAFGSLAALGVFLLVGRRDLRRLALVGAVHVGAVFLAWSPSAAFTLVLCWPAFLGLAGLLAERRALAAPLVAMLGAHQGLLLYCFTQYLRLT